MANTALVVGRLGDAHSWASLGLNRASEASGAGHVDIGHLHMTTSAILLEWNDLQRALTHAESALRCIRATRSTDDHAFALLQLAAVYAAHGDREGALASLDETRQVVLAGSPNPTTQERLVREHIEVLLDLNEYGKARNWVAGLEQHLDHTPEAEALLLRLLVAESNPTGGGERAIRLLKSLRADASLRTRIEMGVASAAALDADKRRNEALVILSTTVQLGEPEGFIRSIARYDTVIAPVLEALRNSGPQGRNTWGPSYLDRIINATKSLRSHAQEDETVIDLTTPYETLSERELQILRLLGGTLSNREIGAELYLSVNTVKTHVKSVYAKLGVNRRSEAVNKGRNLGLLRNSDDESGINV